MTRYPGARLLYRLSVSAHRERFVLKGAVLFSLWSGAPHRATRDVDLLGFGDPTTSSTEAIFCELCDIDTDDGLVFARNSVKAEEIRGGQEYDGVRLRLEARLGQARIRLQVDIGFGDAVVPAPELIEVPSLGGLPPAQLRAYPRDAVIAEKLHALVFPCRSSLAADTLRDLAAWPAGVCAMQPLRRAPLGAGPRAGLIPRPLGASFPLRSASDADF